MGMSKGLITFGLCMLILSACLMMETNATETSASPSETSTPTTSGQREESNPYKRGCNHATRCREEHK